MVSRRVLVPLTIACVFVAAFAFGYPMYVIRPFRPQGPSELKLALAVRSIAPVVATLAAVLSVLAVMAIWRTTGRILARGLGVATAALTVFLAVLTHVNVFELMFKRIETPGAIAARDANLESDDMVLAVQVNQEARAYPVRMMAYHHIANDSVGGEPIVSTY